jgi:membrane protease YdiL (CAAX protease family)
LDELLRQAGPAALAAAAALYLDRRTRRLGLDPPGFREPLRRVLGLGAVALVLWVAVFLPLGRIGSGAEGEPDFSSLPTWQLFLVHLLLLAALAGWYGAGFGGAAGRGPGASAAEQLGLATPGRLREVGVGLLFGVGAWFVVVAGLVLVALSIASLGGEALLPKQPPPAIEWIAGQPLALRAALALSAGVVEEIFFRGLLQPRVGLLFSTGLFALAHLSYDQPFVLVGVTALSVLYGLLVRWRQSLWAAITAHALFDAVQLLIVIPTVLDQFYRAAPAP